MKKILIALASVFGCALLPDAAFAAQMCGDMDGNGSLTSNDVVQMRRARPVRNVGDIRIRNQYFEKAPVGDLNFDGRVDGKDADILRDAISKNSCIKCPANPHACRRQDNRYHRRLPGSL